MERKGPEKAGTNPDTRPAQSNTRFTSPLVINSASRRKSLFSRPTAKEDVARPSSSGSTSDANAASPNKTRIPRPAQRTTFTISDAYRLAEEEEAAQGSPSPAPRPWRTRRESTEKRTAKTGSPSVSNPPRRGGLNGKPLGATGVEGHDDHDVPLQGDLSDSTFDEKLRHHARDQPASQDSGRRSTGLFSRPRLGTSTVDAGKEVKSRGASHDGSSSPRGARTTTHSPSLLRRLPGLRRTPSNASSSAPEKGVDDGDEPLRPSSTPLAGCDIAFRDSQTPNRSFAWQADADFTGGDLQLSNSPPVAIGRSNTKIDQIRALEAELNGCFPDGLEDEPEDTRPDNIPVQETEADLKVVNEPLDSNRIAKAAHGEGADDEVEVPNRRPVSRASMRIDEIRSREFESLSRRALATASGSRGLDVGTSRSPSPDIAHKPAREPIRTFSPLRDRLRRQDGEATAAASPPGKDQAGQNEPLPVSSAGGHSATDTTGPSNGVRVGEGNESHRRVSGTKDRSSDILARLAAARNRSPTPEAQAAADSQASAIREREPTDRARQRRSIGRAKSIIRPTVGFAGLSRSSSVESRLAKRTSFAHSDSDPIERIEGEMKLFAPQENQSERGSLRAPSPEPEEEAPDETPRPSKVDPTTLPTPRVTGAYVETPATVKVEKPEGHAVVQAAEKDAEHEKNGFRRLSTSSLEESKPLLTQSGKEGIASRQLKRTRSTTSDRVLGRSSSVSARRRARSLSRHRAPLINTARPPTVKDDLLEIQRVNQIEDSTLDDIADLLIPQPHRSTPVGAQGIKSETSDNGKLDVEEELKVYDRLSRSLETGLLGIRSAKQGIERLEDKVAHADIKEHPQHTAHGDSAKGESATCPACHGSEATPSEAVTYIHLPLPRLWHRQPKFRFTPLGLLLFLLSLWYLAESAMCFRYCKPDYCYPGMSCGWSSDDPSWGYAIPVKLDQWITGGQGRELARRLQPEVADWLADVRDAATGTDITTVDTSRYSWEQKRQHRRRLAKKGLIKAPVERPEDKVVFDGWKSVREANERAQSAQEMGYEVDEDESIDADERL